MMRVIRKLPFSAVVLSAFLTWAAAIPLAMPAYADTITVSQWSPGVLVDSPIGYDVDHWFSIENPCHRTLHAQVGNSASSGTIDFAWAEQFGTFLIQSQQVAAGAGPGAFVLTDAPGSIRVAVTEPLFLHIGAAWSYNLPADYMLARMLVSVYDAQSHVTIFGQSVEASTLPGEPTSGTLTISGDVILPPGPTWTMRYSMSLDTYPGTEGFFAEGTGSVLFSITPEPSSLSFALFSVLVLMIHRRHLR